MEISAGIVIICNMERILLVHPTGFDWYANLGIPKGHVEEGETIYEAAKREVYEETGIKIDDKYVMNRDKKPFSVLYKKRGEEKPFKKAYVYVAFINTPQDIGLDGYEIDMKDIPMPEEVDHCAFYTKKEAEYMINRKYKPFLKFLRG